MKTEVRFVPMAAGDEVRVVPAADGKPEMIVGYSVIYNSLSQDLGGFRELVRPGAFTRSLASKPDVRARYNHEVLLGRSKSGTLRLFDDPKGLRYEIDIGTAAGRSVAESIARGDVDGSSFCFRVAGADGEAWRKESGGAIRELLACDLMDVGPVDNPAYLGTEGQVGVRSLPDESAAGLAKVLTPEEVRATPALWAARLKLAEKA